MAMEMVILLSLLVVTLGLVLVLWISSRIGNRDSILRELALHKEQGLNDGYIGVPVDMSQYVGRRGVSVTVLRPVGKVKIDGALLDAVSVSEFIDEGEPVVVTKYENTQLYVELPTD